MSALTALKLVTAKRPQSASPLVQRRNKLSNQLWEQIELARASADGKTYTPTCLLVVELQNLLQIRLAQFDSGPNLQ